MGSAWALKKVFSRTRSKIDTKRESIAHKEREDQFWQLGLTLAIAAAEIVVTSLLKKSDDDTSSDAKPHAPEDKL